MSSNEMRNSWRVEGVGWHVAIAAVSILLVHHVSQAQSRLITFEEKPAGTIVTTQYGADGVLFEGAFLTTHPAAKSGTQVLRSVFITAEVFNPVLFGMTFTNRQNRVSLFASSPGTARDGTLRAYDGNGNLVDEDGPKLVAADVFTTRFEVRSNNRRIVRVVLQIENSVDFAIDDLEYAGAPPEPPPPAPQVVITAPSNGAEMDTDSFAIEGTVTGQGLLSSVNGTIEYGRPPEQQSAPPFKTLLSLEGTGTTRRFKFPGGFSVAPLGPIKITIVAENFAGVKGSATVTITNLPLPIRQRAASVGAGTLGSFRFGVVGQGCKTAVYENAAISTAASAGGTFLIQGDILAKWIPHRERLGCPLAEVRERAQLPDDFYNVSNWCIFISGNDGPCSALTVPGVVQNFSGGRIYNTTGIGTFYVPAVFVDAIDKRGGEAVTGVPIADPTNSVGPMQTWLFQRFVVPELPLRLPSTLEIRGSPARLYVERQSGHMIDPHSREGVETTGTIWEHFPCDENLKCRVDPTLPQPEPIPNTGEKFCFGKTLVDTFKAAGAGPRYWEPVLDRFFQTPFNISLRGPDPGNFISTPLFGVVTWAKLAPYDLWLAHEWCLSTPILPDEVLCRSDWIFRVQPYGPHAGTRQFGSLYGGTEAKTSVKVEYERHYADYVLWLGLPRKRDLMFTAGRWVIDCAHDTFKTELHPIFMFAKMKTVTSLTRPFTGIVDRNPFGGTPDNPIPATQADVWVNGWYPGDLIEFDIYPPPRPHPDATLVVNKPIDSQAAFGVNFNAEMEPKGSATRVHVRLTAPLRRNPVTWLGEMKWETGRLYEGQWYVHWSR